MSPPRDTRAWWCDAVAVVCWVSAIMVVTLWVSGHGLQALTSWPGEGLTSLGRIVGLVAADLLLVQVCLMARVPWIERSYGQDELARRHRLVGFWSFNLMVLHIVLVTLGYSASSHIDALHESWTLVTTYGGMLLAVAATAALCTVTLTSIRAARRRLRYESWHLLHLYAYAGVGLSVPHELWTGSDFTSSSLARTYWWASYALAAGAVLVFRLGLPLWRSLRHGITVSSVVHETADVVTVHLAGRGLKRLPVRAGQFFIWRFLDGPGWSRGNPYSLSGAPRRNRIQITAKNSGEGSGRLAQLQPGTRVLIEGPYGRLTGEQRIGSKVAMLACGIGITPMKALLEDLDYEPGHATLVYRARSEAEVIFRDDLAQLVERRGITVHYLVGARIARRTSWLPQSYARMNDSDALVRLIPEFRERDVFVCGPHAWMQTVARAAAEAGLPVDQLHQERFSW